ncbi:hypothetical protein GALMADRAFT_925396 [Galerina marginata CBS 339.88]|uniref:Uncharacterized protein n=1 Tax=Galerina marginata (strain CBS 339.88) TaxID=685588 RepID=A0A067SGT1_GALM3|nr:hypothetical protein GALMADRAFT_925396 [Galerina marginata CBS 339.88]
MKQYKFDVVRDGRVETTLPIADGHSFIFIFSTSEYRKAQEIGINLYYRDDCTHRITFTPAHNFPGGRDAIQYGSIYLDSYGNNRRHWPSLNRNEPHFGLNDANIVVKIEKTLSNSFHTYVNGELLVTTPSISLTNKDMGRIDAAGVAIGTRDTLAATLTVFKYAEVEKSEAFAKAMQNPENTTDINGIMQALGDVEGDATGNEKEGQRAPEKHEPRLGDDEVNNAGLASAQRRLPPDSNLMKLSSTIVWPKAVGHVLGPSVQAEVQGRHNVLINEWIAVVRGNDPSSSTYSYLEFVYSHGVVWPKAIVEFTTDANFWKIREKHIEIITLLEDCFNALGG